MEWRPIESAPKDGENVLLFRMGVKPWASQVVGHWGKPLIGRARWFDYSGEKSLDIGAPTHWQPLPEPPPLNRSQ